MNGFKFELGGRAMLKESGEQGDVTARAEYAHSEPQYLLRYCAGDGRQVEAWWGESAFA